MVREANLLMTTTNIEMNSKNVMGSQNDGKQVLKYAKMICICNIYTNLLQLSPGLWISISVFRCIQKKNT